MKEYLDTRQPIVQGLFYPDSIEEVNNKIKDLLDSNTATDSSYNNLILPHGAWDFTGDYLALGFNSISKKNFKRVILISNVHREPDNLIYLPNYINYKICDRLIPVDLEAMEKISGLKKVVKSNTPHMEENSLEVILPFVNYLYPNAKIVPILLGKTIVSLVRSLSNLLELIYDEETLIIVSSNYAQYQKSSLAKDIGENGINTVLSGDVSELIELTRTNKLQICSGGAISALLLSLNRPKLFLLKSGLSNPTKLVKDRATYYGAFGL